MSVSEADIAFALDLFAPLGGLPSRKIMGGLTIYHDGQVFAIIDSEGTPYLKASGTFADEMATNGARQFSSVDKKGKINTMGYWTLPETALDESEVACDWALKALNGLK